MVVTTQFWKVFWSIWLNHRTDLLQNRLRVRFYNYIITDLYNFDSIESKLRLLSSKQAILRRFLPLRGSTLQPIGFKINRNPDVCKYLSAKFQLHRIKTPLGEDFAPCGSVFLSNLLGRVEIGFSFSRWEVRNRIDSSVRNIGSLLSYFKKYFFSLRRTFVRLLTISAFVGFNFANAGLRSQNQNHSLLRPATQFFQTYAGRVDEYIRPQW